MKNVNILSMLIIALALTFSISSCKKDKDEEEIQFKSYSPAGEITETVWEANSTVTIESDVVVPEGKSLTIKEGVKIIFKGSNLGTAEAPEFQVRGNLYVLGTENKKVRFTVESDQQTEANKYVGLWGGIQCASTCSELALNHTIIEYAGAVAGANSIFVEQGEDEGDPRYAIFYGNTSGKYLLSNSTIRNTADDATRCVGGTVSFVNNYFSYIGETGGEAINLKSGVTGDMCFNLFYNCSTNGTKWSNSGDRTPQTSCKSYNNTFVNCGWRRNKEGRGGSVNIEKEARGASYNQLIVNCKYGVRVVGGEDAADTSNVYSDYAFYFGNEQIMIDEFYPTHGILPYLHNTCNNDIKGTLNANDPMFENYNVATGKLVNMDLTALDFHLKSNSPALTGGKTDFSPQVPSMVLGGITYSTPNPTSYFGAFGNY